MKRRNIAKKKLRIQQENLNRTDVISGIPTPFTNSLLRPSQVYTSANTIQNTIDSTAFHSTTITNTFPLSENKHYRNFFLDEEDEEFLFRITPKIIAENSGDNTQENND